jgi:site-specific recombinase XerD
MELLQKINPKIDVYRGQSVILCQFFYDKDLLIEFRKKFPYAKWSQSKKSWYVLDRIELRKIFGLSPKKPLEKKLEKFNKSTQSYIETYSKTLQLKGYSISTQKTYLGEFSQFLQFFEHKNANELTHKDVNQYFWHCIHKLKLSENQIHSRINAVKSYYRFVANSPIKLDLVIRPKKKEMLPEVLSKTEVKAIFDTVENPKHLLMLKLCYGMGLRVSEIINLRITDISSSRMQVHIRCAKGKKDRMVNLPQSVLEDLREYYKLYKPTDYLFEGQYGGQYTVRSVQVVFKRAMIKAKVNKKIGIHGLRHSFATHLLERGTDMVFIQKLLGHKNVKTTEIYAKVSNQILSRVESPLDDL